MNYIIVDDEPIARDGIQMMADNFNQLTFSGSFNNPLAAAEFIKSHKIDLVF